MEREGIYSLVVKERADGFFAFEFRDPSWHVEGCSLANVVKGPGEYFDPRYFIVFEPGREIEICYDCGNWRFTE